MVDAEKERAQQKRDYDKLQKDEGELREMTTSLLRERSESGAGLGRGSMAKRQKLQNGDGGLGNKIRSRFEQGLLKKITVFPPPGWLVWHSSNGRKFCWQILRIIGFAGPDKEDIPQSFGGDVYNFWCYVKGIINKQR